MSIRGSGLECSMDRDGCRRKKIGSAYEDGRSSGEKTNSAFWHQAVRFDERHYFRKHGEIAVVAKVLSDARNHGHSDAHRATAHADACDAEPFEFAHRRRSRTSQNIQWSAHAAHQPFNRGRILHAGSE